VVASQLSPVSPAEAVPRVQQFLYNQRASEAVAADMKRLRSATTITYMGEFASTSVAEKSNEKPAVAPADSAPTAIDKGVAGLK